MLEPAGVVVENDKRLKPLLLVLLELVVRLLDQLVGVVVRARDRIKEDQGPEALPLADELENGLDVRLHRAPALRVLACIVLLSKEEVVFDIVAVIAYK